MDLSDYSDNEIEEEYDRRVRREIERAQGPGMSQAVADQFLAAIDEHLMNEQLAEIQDLPEV